MLTINNIGKLYALAEARVTLVEMEGTFYIFNIENKTRTETTKVILSRTANRYGKYMLTVGDISIPGNEIPIEDIKDINKFIQVLRFINNDVWPFS